MLPGINTDPYADDDKQRLHDSLLEGYRDNVFLKDVYRNGSLDVVARFTYRDVMHIVDFTHPNATKYWTA